MSSHSKEDTYTYCMSLRDTSAGLKLEEKRLETGTAVERLETVTVRGSVSGVLESHKRTSCKHHANPASVQHASGRFASTAL